MQSFLNHTNSLMNLTVLEESKFLKRDMAEEDGVDSIGNDLCYDFIKTEHSEIGQESWKDEGGSDFGIRAIKVEFMAS